MGQEEFDFSEIPLPEDASINVESENIVHRSYLGTNVDFYLNSIFTIAFSITETYHIDNELGNFIPYVGLGVKFV